VRLGTSLLLILLGTAPMARAQAVQPAAGSARDSAAGRPTRAPRRQPVTPELERTAFADPLARTLLARARAARVTQDSALRAYDAHTRQRLSVALRVGRLGPQRQLIRHEAAARVRWARGAGLWVEPTARRTGFPMGGAEMDLTAATPIPYFPGREALWLPFDALGRVAKSEVNENDLLHPLATGAEAYYRYATGDSVSIRLPDGSAVALRELRITARRPDWRGFVGSFWFDVERGALVRAAYRSSAAVDLWQAITDDQRREIREWEARARTDTGAAARHARAEAARIRSDFGGVGAALAKGMLSPLRADVAAVTVEYGLHDGRFWLPRLHVAEGEAQGGFVRMPVRVEERFRYGSVNGTDSLPPVTAPAEMGLAADDTTWSGEVGVIALGPPGAFDARRRADTVAAVRLAREDTLLGRLTLRADSLRASAAQARARGDTSEARRLGDHAAWFASRARRITRRREACVRDSSYVAGTHALPDAGPAHGDPPALRPDAPRPLDRAAGLHLRPRRGAVRQRRARRASGLARPGAAVGVGAAAPGAARRARSAALQPHRGTVDRPRRHLPARPRLHRGRTGSTRHGRPGAQRRALAGPLERPGRVSPRCVPPIERRQRRPWLPARFGRLGGEPAVRP
jgi:hypothetical protein